VCFGIGSEIRLETVLRVVYEKNVIKSSQYIELTDMESGDALIMPIWYQREEL
jgi:hypothetical protein